MLAYVGRIPKLKDLKKAMSNCSHCATQRATLQRCSRCKHVSYCGAECQNAAWKGHKKSCMSVDDALGKVNTGRAARDWREVLKWEGRMEQMMEHQDGASCNSILEVFFDAHRMGSESTGNRDHLLAMVRLQTRRGEVLCKMQRFRDQGEALVRVADHLRCLDKPQESSLYLQRARKIAEAHGFFSVECRSCLGLGILAREGGRDVEGADLLRNALLCAPLSEEGGTIIELNVLHSFIDALFHTLGFDEVEPLIARYREAAKAESDKQGRLTLVDFHCLYTSARLHEVLCSCPPTGVGPPSHCSALACHCSANSA